MHTQAKPPKIVRQASPGGLELRGAPHKARPTSTGSQQASDAQTAKKKGRATRTKHRAPTATKPTHSTVHQAGHNPTSSSQHPRACSVGQQPPPRGPTSAPPAAATPAGTQARGNPGLAIPKTERAEGHRWGPGSRHKGFKGLTSTRAGRLGLMPTASPHAPPDGRPARCRT